MGYLSHKMDKYDKYNPDEETIEAWLKGFEIRLLCNNIAGAERKRNWCRSLVGEAGNSIIEKLPHTADWTEIKKELCAVLGEGDPKKRAFEVLSSYKPKGKGLGEMATEIMAKAELATSDADLQTQLGLKAFLQAVPRNIGRELRRRHFDSVKEALKEARFLKSVEEDESRGSGKIFTVDSDSTPSVEEPKPDIQQIVEACMKQMQAQQPRKERSERPGYARKRRRCWCCGQKGHLVRACPLIQQNKAACKQKAEKRMPESARGCQNGPDGANGCQMVPEGGKGCQMVLESARGCQRVPDGARGFQTVSDGARGFQVVPECTRGCQRVPDGARGRQMVSKDARGCQRVPDGTNGCQVVPVSTRGCQKDQVGTVVAPGLGKTSDLIFVTVSIAGVEVVALVDTGATTSCCRWEWYQQWKDHLGDVIKSKVRIMGVGPDPIRIKGLTKPLTLHWDGVGGKFQLMILTALTDVDVVLGMDVLSQFDVKINFKKQVASPAREPCTPLEPAKTVGLLLDNPGFTLKGKIPVKEEGVEEVAKNVLRPAYREFNRVWLVSERKRKDLRIAPESFMPWDKAGYKDQLKRDLEDIRRKLSQVLGRDLSKNGHLNMEATRPVNCIEGGVLVDLCKQRSGERGSGCYGPEEIFKSPTLADISWRSSGGSSIPVTSSLMPPKPARTGRKQYSWQNPPKKDICMHIRIINPWECRKEKKEMTFKSQGSINCPHKTNDEVASLNSYVTRAPAVLSVEETSSLVARKRFLPTEYSALSLIDNFRKRWMAFKGFVSLLVIRLIMILGIFGGIMKISRCEGKSRIGNSMECAPRESLGNVRILSLFSNFLEYLNTILRFRKELWNNMIGNLVCKRNKRGTRKRKRIWSFASRPTLELRNLRLGNAVQETFRLRSGNTVETFKYEGLWGRYLHQEAQFPIDEIWSFASRPTLELRNLRLGNAVQETFRLRSGNTVETFMDTKHFPICLCLFLDLCASCRGQLGLFKENLKIRIRVKAIYVNIYLFIYVFCCALLSCKLAAYPGAFAIKMYTLVYFSPKVNLLERKYHHKNQSINLIGLAHVGKAYSRNRLFLGPNRPYWRELRPLVTPWVKSIKEGTDPWRNQKWALLSQCPGKLPSSLSLSPLLLLLSFVLVFFTITICL